MKNLRLILVIPTLLLLIGVVACDENNGSDNANAQPAPMSGTDVMGTINPPSAQTCPENVMIEGFKSQDVITLKMIPTQDGMAEATITNLTANTTAVCAGMADVPLISEVMSCSVSSSNIEGVAVNDMLELSVAFSSQLKEIVFANLSGSMGLECAFANLDTISASN
ncbi:MAG: hypothetical protein AAF462_00910 [Thermodesulfobacteriota bacterium]